MRTIFFTYSGTAPYGHFGNTVTSLLGPLFFAARQNDHSFSLKKKTLVNTAKCFWPIVDRINRVPYQNFRNRQLLPNFKGPAEKLWRPTIFCQTGKSFVHWQLSLVRSSPQKTSFNWPFWSYEKFRVSYANKVAKTKNWWLFFVLMRTRPQWDLKGFLNHLIAFKHQPGSVSVHPY